MGLHFNHQREILDAPPGLPTALNPDQISRETLLKHALHKIVDRSRYYRAHQRCREREVEARRAGEESSDAATAELLFATYLTPSREAVAREELRAMESAFERLPEDYRVVITLAKIVGLSHRAIGEEMGRSEGAVRVRIHRTLRKLKSDIARLEELET